MDERLDENYEICYEDLEDILDVFFVFVDEFGNMLNLFNDMDVKEVVVKEIIVVSLVIFFYIKFKRVFVVVDIVV